MGEHRPSSSRKRSARVIQLICAYQSICDGLFCIFGISWLTSRKTIKMRFYFYWPEPFYVSSSDIHTYSFSFFSSLSLSSQFNSVRFSLALCCMLVVFVLFRFVFFVSNLRLHTSVQWKIPPIVQFVKCANCWCMVINKKLCRVR